MLNLFVSWEIEAWNNHRTSQFSNTNLMMEPTVWVGGRIRERLSVSKPMYPKALSTSLRRSPVKGSPFTSGSPTTKAVIAPESKQPFRLAFQGCLSLFWQGLEPKKCIHFLFEPSYRSGLGPQDPHYQYSWSSSKTQRGNYFIAE